MRHLLYRLSVLLLCAFAVCPAPVSAASPRFQFWAMARFERPICAVTASPRGTTLTTPFITTAGPWDELIVSWNADVAPSGSLEVFARADCSGRRTHWYSLGFWADPGHRPPRTSRPRQTDADGEVRTDTLCLIRPARRFQIKVVSARPVRLRYLSAITTNSHTASSERPGRQSVWGRVLPVPAISQRAFSGGDAWCSPTSVSMVLSYWARTCGRPDWRRTPPQCAQGVYDAAWDGTGNWPFNAAYAGALPGLRAYVTRLDDVRALEDWISQGVPVILSVSIDLNVPDDQPGPAGHLIVCTGFAANGDLTVNDPWTDLTRGERVSRTIPRRRLPALWAKSKHTVYVIHPATMHPPQENPSP